MKTWQAVLAHIGIGALQVAGSVPYFSPGLASTGNALTDSLANTGVQIGAQAVLALLQGLAAWKNSNTDSEGNKLAKI